MVADSVRYNFEQNEGVAFNVRGRYGELYFRNETRPGDPSGPQFQVLLAMTGAEGAPEIQLFPGRPVGE